MIVFAGLLIVAALAGAAVGLIMFIVQKVMKKPTKKAKTVLLLSVVSFIASLVLAEGSGEFATEQIVADEYVEEAKEEAKEGTKTEAEESEPEVEENDADVDEKELTDEEMERVQTIFKEYVGEELKYKPKYAGEWRNGEQYVTENFAYGQYLINMDADGHVNLVVWVQDKKGEEGRTVVYNRLEDGDAPETPNDGAIHLVEGYEGEYGTTAESGFIHYKVPAGTYTVVNEGKRAVVFVVADNDPNDERYYIPMTDGESAEITVDEDAHIELSASSMIALKRK